MHVRAHHMAGFIAGLALAFAGCSAFSLDRMECTTDEQCRGLLNVQNATCNVDQGYCVLPGPCEASSECRASYGFGFACVEGACEPLAEGRINERCAKVYPEGLLVPGAYPDAIVFGSLVERGWAGDAVLENAVSLAIEQANEGDGLDGRVFGAVFCDFSEDATYDRLPLAEAAVATAQWLATEVGVEAIHGPTTSDTTERVYEALRGQDVLLVSPSATSPDLTILDGTKPSDSNPGLLWRTVPPDSLQGQAIAADMHARGIERVVVVAEESSYATGLSKVFVENFRDNGGQVVGVSDGGEGGPLLFSDPNTRDDQLTAANDILSQDRAQELLFISGEISDSVAMLNFIAGADAFTDSQNPRGVFLTDTSKTGDLFNFGDEPGDVRPEVQAILPQLRLTAPAPATGPVYDNFAGAYRARYPEKPGEFGFLPPAYDATWLMIYGTGWALFQEGEITGPNIARGLRKLSDGISIDVTGTAWRTVRSAMQNGTTVDINGASGELDFDPTTEELENAKIDVLAIRCQVDQDTMEREYAFEAVAVGGDPSQQCS